MSTDQSTLSRPFYLLWASTAVSNVGDGIVLVVDRVDRRQLQAWTNFFRAAVLGVDTDGVAGLGIDLLVGVNPINRSQLSIQAKCSAQ